MDGTRISRSCGTNGAAPGVSIAATHARPIRDIVDDASLTIGLSFIDDIVDVDVVRLCREASTPVVETSADNLYKMQ